MKPQISWKLVGEEAEEYKRTMVKRLVDKYNMSEAEAEESCDMWIAAVNEVAKEWGEDV